MKRRFLVACAVVAVIAVGLSILMKGEKDVRSVTGTEFVSRLVSDASTRMKESPDVSLSRASGVASPENIRVAKSSAASRPLSNRDTSPAGEPTNESPGALGFEFKLITKSFLSPTAQTKVNRAMANEGQFFEAPSGMLEQLQESSAVTFEYNGRRLEGKVSYLDPRPFTDQDGRTAEISFGNSAELKVYTEKGLVRGSLRDNGKLYQLEGFEGEWVIMDFYTYKRLNNALVND